jgi:transposase
MMVEMVEIYELLDPANGACRYVGQSRNAKKRYEWHLTAAGRGNVGYVYNWIRALLRTGAKPVLRVVCSCSEQDADREEMRWIAARKAEGARLTNGTDGGGGIRGWRHSAETRALIGAKHAGKVVSTETRARISDAKRRAPPPSIETRLRMSIASRGRKMSEANKEASSLRMRGNQHARGAKRSAATIAKMKVSASRKAAKFTDAEVVEIRASVAAGVTQRSLAAKLGVSCACISRIVNKKTYTGV